MKISSHPTKHQFASTHQFRKIHLCRANYRRGYMFPYPPVWGLTTQRLTHLIDGAHDTSPVRAGLVVHMEDSSGINHSGNESEDKK